MPYRKRKKRKTNLTLFIAVETFLVTLAAMLPGWASLFLAFATVGLLWHPGEHFDYY